MSCFGGQDLQIYLFETLIEKLTLTRGKIKDVGDHPMLIKVQFLDFPPFEITRQDFYSVKPVRRDEDGSLAFNSGESRLFVKQPKELIREIQACPVKVGVFRVGDTYPIAEADLTVTGCLCDQIAMTANDAENLPKPFVTKGGFNLLDPGENLSGTLDMELRLTCFGRNVKTHFELAADLFVFRNEGHEREYVVNRMTKVAVAEEVDLHKEVKITESKMLESVISSTTSLTRMKKREEAKKKAEAKKKMIEELNKARKEKEKERAKV